MGEFGGAEERDDLSIEKERLSAPSDRRLMVAARKGSSEAVEALVARHWDSAQRIAYGILGDSHAAEDVTQEAMLSVIGGIGRFDPYRPLAPWLHRIVTNRALDWSRSRARRAEVPAGALAEDAELVSAVQPGPDPVLREALGTLPAEQRAIVVLRFVGGYGPGEIARLLGIPRGTVGSRLRRALDQLRPLLEEEDHG